MKSISYFQENGNTTNQAQYETETETETETQNISDTESESETNVICPNVLQRVTTVLTVNFLTAD